MPLQATSGAASYDAFGGGVPVAVNYIEDVFSTYLYTGNGTALTINNGIDLSTKGGLVWVKRRAFSSAHGLIDTARGRSSVVYSNETSAESISSAGTDLTSFNTNGFSIGTNNNVDINISDNLFASWTFRKQPKFFDIQTWTGTGSNRTISHSLGSVPACIMVKRTDLSGAWQVYHRSLANTEYLVLNTTAAKATGATRWNSTTPTSTVFSIGTDATVNSSGATYVAYIFAHDAGGFGLTGTDNVISCGLFTSDGSGNATINLGYEPQWVLVKQSATISAGYGDWYLLDNMRGWTTDGGTNLTNISFNPNLSGAEFNAGSPLNLNSTGFTFKTTDPNWQSKSFIYIAIRRGPMKVPTSGTSVFFPQAYADTSLGSTNPVLLGASTGFPVDMMWDAQRNQAFAKFLVNDRLRGSGLSLTTGATDEEGTSDGLTGGFATMNGALANGTDAYYSSSALGRTFVAHFFRRAPSYFDVVCYTGTGSNTTQTHNLGVVPELMIVRNRSTASGWACYSSSLGNTKKIRFDNTAAAVTSSTSWNDTTPTSSVFSIGTSTEVNTSADKYVAYLFATCAGVSKVGSYTGTATTLQIDCGFTGGARFVLIRRTDAQGDWYVWDTARGIVAGNDPYLRFSNTAAETTNTDYIDTYSAGFEISSTAPTGINASGGSFIFLAIA